MVSSTTYLLTVLFIIVCKEQFAESLDYRRTRYRRNTNDDDDNGVSSWIDGEKFQGDIDGYDEHSFKTLVKEMNDWQERRQQHGDNSRFDSATSDPRGLWMNGRVPYVVEFADEGLKNAVSAAIEDFNKFTCIKFIPRTNEPNYVRIIGNDKGCHSALGNIRQGAQVLSLGSGCHTKGIAIHEMMHAIGFWHEHQRTDRDDYVIVFPENVIEKYRYAYDKAQTSQMNLIGKYDMDSVMHYRYKDFALPGKIAMKAKHSDRTNFGNEAMSPEDIKKIRELYRCDNDKGSTSIVPGVEYYIKAPGTNNCWDVPGQSTDDGMQLQQWDCNHSPAQKFMFNRLDGSVYTIKNTGNGKLLDVALEQLNEDGGKVQQWSKIDNQKNQQFNIVQKEGNFHITSAANGKIIWVDLEGKLRHWQYDAGQNWQLERV